MRQRRGAGRIDVNVRLEPKRAREVLPTGRERKDWRQWMELSEGTSPLRPFKSR